jgi:hypothetical protein
MHSAAIWAISVYIVRYNFLILMNLQRVNNVK